MNQNQFAEGAKFVPILAPVDAVATAKATSYVDLTEALWATFVVNFGVITTGTATITVEASTAGSSNATEAAIPFKYRLTGAVGTDTLGAITAATSDGAAVATDADGKAYIIEVDPAALPANPGADYKWLRVVVSPTTDMAACLVGANAILQPRYPGNSLYSSS
jgi:hypothetical protein